MEKENLVRLETVIDKLVNKYNALKKENEEIKNDYELLKNKVLDLITKLEEFDKYVEETTNKKENDNGNIKK